jgi:hypothetical protein
MGVTSRDLGTRVELVSMDPHFKGITIALYRREQSGRPEYLVHTFSSLDGAADRIAFIRRAMVSLGGFRQEGEGLVFECGNAHQTAARRAFLDACKLDGTTIPERTLTIHDKQLGGNVTAEWIADGIYRVNADGGNEGHESRIESIAAGLRKLGELTAPPTGESDQVVFPCNRRHDVLVSLLLPRALNVRSALREFYEAAGRGLLVAPSQQR